MMCSVEAKRGCGYRKAGGYYLMADGVSRPCGLLPIPLETCPCCGQGFLDGKGKPARGWTWINLKKLVAAAPRGCRMAVDTVLHPGSQAAKICGACPLQLGQIEEAGLIWIGDAHYSMDAWQQEAATMGISRKISRPPRGFKIGETWVLVAHRKAISRKCDPCQGSGRIVGTRKLSGGLLDGQESASSKACGECGGEGVIFTPAIFSAFRPQRLDYVVKGTETAQELDALEARGITPVRVVRDTDQCPREKAGGRCPEASCHKDHINPQSVNHDEWDPRKAGA